ncbi:unnamed protein product [Enterobius vermicularis]|uniref:NNMT/PNMT/TEMT family protein n=1 Tax=Enterobius vermicularis TaxID=51028 RepID=A0A0N4VM04_ENTVE|nr:unnamed protein product [Enterobius vermicularis]
MPEELSTNGSKERSENDNEIPITDNFHESFNTAAYLQDFYTRIDDPAMQMVVLFLPNIVQRLDEFESLLDFGAGPTVHVAAIFRNKAKNIYLADYLAQNRQELYHWLNGTSKFDWTETFKKIASVEGHDWQELKSIESLTRSKVKGIFHCDCHQADSVKAPENLKCNFDVVSTVFCIEYSSRTTEEYQNAVKNVVSHVKPGGLFVMGGVFEETWCSFGGKKFPCFYLTEELLFATLRDCGLLIDDPDQTICYNINGIYLICSRKRSNF